MRGYLEGRAYVDRRRLSRRVFLRVGLGMAAVSLLAACAPAAPATKPAETKPAETKPAEAAKPAADAKPTTAPAAAAKPAERRQAGRGRETGRAGGGLGASPRRSSAPNLIGKIEGAVIQPEAKRPVKLGEAPMLAELVKAGKLPPVEQRVRGAAGRQAAARDRQVRRDVAARLHRPGDSENGNRVVRARQACSTGTSPAQVVPERRQGLGAQRRR